MSDRYTEDEKEFEDFVKTALWHDGIAVYMHSSKSRQCEIGEGSSVEVKLDQKFRTTGQFYIETDEKPRGSGEYRPSGIHRGDRTWLWAIGDRRDFYLIPKTYLLQSESGPVERLEANRPGDTPTRGFGLPVTWAVLACCRHYENGRPKERRMRG